MLYDEANFTVEDFVKAFVWWLVLLEFQDHSLTKLSLIVPFLEIQCSKL